jgi:hypothetical protein
VSGRHGIRSAAIVVCWLSLYGCATPSLPPLDPELVRDSERQALQRTWSLRERLFDVSYRLRAGGRGRCGSLLLPDPGLLLGAPGRFERARAGASPGPRIDASPGLDVLQVVSMSPLARAGVRAGDVLVDLDGRPPTEVSELNEWLSLSTGPSTLGFRRGAQRYQVRVDIPRICAVQVHYADDPGLMTFQRKASVAVPYGLLETAREDWLAIAVAHQIAHVLIDFASSPVLDREATADRLGLLLAAEAGFDVGTASAFWEWLASENPWRIPSTRAFRLRRPHPVPGTELEYPTSQLHVGIARRLPAIRTSIEQILALQRETP